MKFRVWTLWLGVCFGLAMPLARGDTDSFWTLEPKTVSRMEARIVMPVGAKPLAAFTRYYEPGFDHGRRVVFGLLTERGDRKIHIGPNHPIAVDGGCSVVNTLYDVEADRITSITCNGVA
jgi:hypothetical protein